MDKTIIRPFPAQTERVETGAIRFGDDWPGTFLRGDNSAFYAITLVNCLEHRKFDAFSVNILKGLAEDLTECIQGEFGGELRARLRKLKEPLKSPLK